ncbi:MAG: sugar transferase [Patescibacteria group bacterium]
MKRLADIVISVTLIVILWPLMLIIGLMIKIDSSGPIFYSHKKNGQPDYRLGKGAKLFYYFKFRSMYVNTETVTKFGYFIRRWHLDELPELFLVLIGNMSLVGPRPLPRGRVRRNIKCYYESLKAKPGITGPIQINRNKNNTIEDVIIFNNWYADHLCFLTDLIIILKTPLAIIKQKEGASSTLSML